MGKGAGKKITKIIGLGKKKPSTDEQTSSAEEDVPTCGKAEIQQHVIKRSDGRGGTDPLSFQLQPITTQRPKHSRKRLTPIGSMPIKFLAVEGLSIDCR